MWKTSTWVVLRLVAELIAVTQRLESVLVARRLAAVEALLWHRVVPEDVDPDKQYDFVDGVQKTCAEVSALLDVSAMAASYMVHYAQVLGERLPKGGQPGCPARENNSRRAIGARVLINVVADAETVGGGHDRPGYLEGYGVIDAEQVRDLAAGAVQRLLDTDLVTADPYSMSRQRR
jgi:hypothetical protein